MLTVQYNEGMFTRVKDRPLVRDIFVFTNHQRVLSLLAERAGTSLFVREVSSLAGISYGGASEALADLAALGLIQREQRGKLTLCTANAAHPLICYFKVLLNLAALAPLLDELKPIASEVILFGSCAEGTNTTQSDIDLFVIAEDKEAIYEAVRQSPLAEKIRPIVSNLIESIETKQRDTLFYEQVMRGITLWRSRGEDES